MREVDYIIVGQGLAGSCLALEFLKRDKKIIVIDKVDSNSSSRIAAGVFNPITGRTNQSTWRAKEIFETLFTFYAAAEQYLSGKFLLPLPVYRPFLSKEEQMKWPAESNAWISQVFLKPKYPEFLNDPYGGIEIKKSGLLNTTVFLELTRQMVETKGDLMEENFDYGELRSDNKITYKDTEASKIIFCEGIKMDSNPWFNGLPIRNLKGELLLAKGNLPPDRIINRGIFSVPTANQNQFILGSTYQHDLSPGNTSSGVDEIIMKAKKIFKNPVEILSQSWGHRPTTLDRRPFLGHHPSHKNICIFNGMGTKGVSLAPFFAVHFANWLEGLTELDREVNIERYYSLPFKLK